MPIRLALLLVLLGVLVASVVSLGAVPLSLAPGRVSGLSLIALLPVLAGAVLDRLAGIARALARWSRNSWRATPAPPAEVVDDLYQRGLDARDAGRTGAALKTFQEIVRREPAHAEAHARLGELARERGDSQSALLHSLHALRGDERPVTALTAADAYRRAGRHDDAIALYRDVLGRDPDHLTALRRLRDALAELGRWAEAVPAQERLVKLASPEERAAEQVWLAGIHYELGAARLGRDDAAGAIAAFREALRARPDFVPAAVALGDAHLKAGDASQAVRAWERGIEAQPALPLLARVEQVYRAEGRPRRMIGLYEQAAARAPDDLALAVALGRVHFELSMLDEAAEQFEKVEVRAPDLPSVHAYLGAIFERRGQAREAFEEYRRALRLTSSFEWPYRCAACGASHAGWADRCPSCRQWNTLRA